MNSLRAKPKETRKEARMTAYEFYWQDKEHGSNLIGVLPERRQSLDRITDESVVSWLRTVLGDALGPYFDKVYFIRVEV